MEKVSIIVPVLKESNLLESILARFLKDTYLNKEIIAIIDEPTSSSLKVVRRFKSRVKFLLNEKRVGKSNALNAAVKESSGDILFFFDSDNKINGNSNNTVSKLVEQMSGAEIAEPTVDTIKDSFLSKMVGFEFTSSSFAGFLYSNIPRLKPALGGAALLIRRNIFFELGGFRNFIAEDVDLTWRAFEKGKIYKQIKSVRVLTKTPSNFSGWLIQRKRWAIGTVDWFFRGHRSIITNTFKKASYITIPSILMLFPTILLGIIGILLSESFLEQSIIFSLILIPLKLPELASVVFYLISSIVILKSIVIYILGFTISSSATYIASRIMRYDFRMSYFVIYYFFYSPLTLISFLYGFIKVGLFRNLNLSDWKV